MSVLAAIATGLASVVFVSSVVAGLLFWVIGTFVARSKLRGWSKTLLTLVLPLSLVVTIGGAWVFSAISDQEAVSAGFASAQDQRQAKAAGFVDPAAWNVQREANAQRARAEAEEQAKRDQEDRQAKAALAAQQKAAEEARRAEEAAAKKTAELAKEEECRTDLACYGEKAIEVAILRGCKQAVERFARYKVDWSDGLLNPLFSHYRWKSQKSGVVTVIGNKVSFQNGFGAEVPMIYECDVDVAANALVDVRVTEGRL